MKLIANKACQGFQGKYWEKGEEVTIQDGEKYPKEHFDELAKAPAPKKSKEELEEEKIAAKEKAKADAAKKLEAERLAKEKADNDAKAAKK